MISKSERKNDMKNFELLGEYKGVNIYVIPLFDFIMLDEDEQRTHEHMWMISDDHRLIYKGMIVGQVSKNRSSVSDYATPTSYTMFYGKYLRAKKEKEHKPEASVKVVTERVTVEKLRAEGESRFKAVVRESEEKYRNTGLEIEKKLKLLEIERDALIRKVKR
jgi:hypothetical protein